jgi:phosphogluconate dehydratase
MYFCVPSGIMSDVSRAPLDPIVAEVTERVVARSAATRDAYLERIAAAAAQGPARERLGCGNLAHGLAACGAEERALFGESRRAGVAIVTAYNDMLSAHQPFAAYPGQLRRAVASAGGVAQVAGGVPAMCDGITQGRPGMELSLFSRDVVALSTGVALSHDMFDAALLLGVCDKIVPGLLIGALAYGHLPALLVPAGPMPSGLSNVEKSRVRQLHAEGKASREQLLAAEQAAYHAPGTCTFYGTANSNQVLVEAMGLQLPGAGFVNPGTPLRQALTRTAGRRIVALTALGGGEAAPLGELVDERAIVNAIVALLASGGSTNHTLHLVAIAAAAGIRLEWDDFAALSRRVPLLARIYPNGAADVNDFHAAGGTALLIGQLLEAGLLHRDVRTVMGEGLDAYARQPALDIDGRLTWEPVEARP